MKLLAARVQSLDWILGSILLLGLLLRVWGINFGLPYMYDPDEGATINIVLRMLHTGDLNPRFFDWPSFSLYLYLASFWALYLIGALAGRFATTGDLPFPDQVIMAVGKASAPEEFIVGRGVTVAVGVLSILMVYLICRRLVDNKAVARLAALLFAVEPISIWYSRIIRPDTFVVFFILLSFWFVLKAIELPSLKNYLLAGIVAGLGISIKYNAALILVSLGLAHLVNFGWRALCRKEIYLATLVAAIVFVATTPFAILDFSQFYITGPIGVAGHYVGGHPGAEGDSLQWYIGVLQSNQGWVPWVALAEVVWIMLHRNRQRIVLLGFPVVYFSFICLYLVHFEETIMPVLPFVAILAALFFERAFQYSFRLLRIDGWPRNVANLGLGLLLAWPMLQVSTSEDIRLSQPDGREQARQWIDLNLPLGSRIALESYSPYVDREKFAASGFYGIQDHSPDWYVSNGYEYLIFSQGVYGRYFADPSRYAAEIDRYNSFFDRFQQIARFDGNGFEIRIFKMRVVLPAHRVAARFGNYGELVELVGYDDALSKGSPGDPLKVMLYWRTLGTTPEPLELELRLLDKSDHVVGSARGDLFQGRGWPDGIFASEWTIGLLGDTAPGMYSLAVNVMQTRFNYTTPAKNWAEDDIGQVTLGPFKLAALPPSASELQAARPTDVRFGGQIALVGYSFDNVRPGGTLLLTLHWKALAQPARDYTVFVHLLDAEGKVRAQVDAQPRGGAYPTSIWEAGEIIRDEYALPLPANLAQGLYRIEIGFYEFPGLARLAATDTKGVEIGDHWLLPESVKLVP